MHILTVNTGSTSVKLDVFDTERSTAEPQRSVHEHGKDVDPKIIFERLFQHIDAQAIDVVTHRFVHGGHRLLETSFIDKEVEAALQQTLPMAPLHNPTAVRWLRFCEEHFPDTPHAGVFDTAFFADLPPVTAHYPIPETPETRDIRRFGFHGLAHRAMWQRWCREHPELKDGGRIVTLQLGGGCSATAIENGRPLDNSMGFSPLEGLMMATRSGDLDPGALIYLAREKGLSLDRIEAMLNEESGLAGVSQQGADMKALLESDTERARLAVDMYCYRIRKYLGAFMTVLGGADGIVFGGGVGENSAEVRAAVLEPMQWLGIELDAQANDRHRGTAGEISADHSPVKVWVVPVNEGQVMVEETLQLCQHRQLPDAHLLRR